MEYSLAEESKLVEKVSEYVVAYDFEVYDILGTIHWFHKYRIIMLIIIVLYLLSVYFGQKWMKNRPPFKLTFLLFFWNFGLALFSIICTWRGIPEFLYLLSKPDGAYLVACVGFHHAAMLVICWIGYEHYETVGRAFFVNTFVHSFMYSYYALKALGVEIPKRIAQALTTLQIVQLVAGMSGAAYILYLLVFQGRSCRMHFETFWLGVSIVAIFLVLFIKLYVQRYLSRNKNMEV
ncbi:unnamed protein product [Allacma fusca]|uniref:Elongation of very long chain fatty acids protein n=1 Tax=Allacma fusca TaxID=39272 RepID=A0A8J2PB19_9HEXA|nr:unnamed protein product [Allacma fusca]